MLENLVGARGEIQIIGSESKCRGLLFVQGHAGSSVDVANEPQNMMKVITRPSVNYAKDWLDQFFPIPGLVLKRVHITCGCDHYMSLKNHFPVQ